MKFRPRRFGLLAIGATIILLGAIAKITKEEFGNILLLTGVIIEIFGVFYAINYSKIKKV